MSIYTIHLNYTPLSSLKEIKIDETTVDKYSNTPFKKIFAKKREKNYPILLAIIFNSKFKHYFEYRIGEGRRVYKEAQKDNLGHYKDIIYFELIHSRTDDSEYFTPIGFHSSLYKNSNIKNLLDCNYENPQNQFIISRHYSDLSIPKKAKIWLKKAAEGNFTKAQVNLVISYLREKSKEKIKKGIGYYKKYLLKKPPNIFKQSKVLYELALCYNDSKKYKVNPQKAFNYFSKAAELGHVKSILELANCYHFGCGIEPNIDLSIYWLKEAALRNSVDAEFALGLAYYTKLIDGTLDNTLYWLKPLASKGHSEALYILGKICEFEYKNLKKAIECYSFSDCIYAKLKMAQFYFNGVGVNKNLDKSLDFFRESMYLDVGIEMFFQFYDSLCDDILNMWCPIKVILSLEWHREALYLGHPKALEMFKSCYNFIRLNKNCFHSKKILTWENVAKDLI